MTEFIAIDQFTVGLIILPFVFDNRIVNINIIVGEIINILEIYPVFCMGF